MDFKLVSDYAPMGDQPEAIGQLVSSIEHGSKHNTLLGVTGSGKTFTVANVIARLNRPTLVLSHNKTLAAQLYGEFRNFFPENAVEYFVSYYDYYQPEAYLPSTDTYIEKDLQINAEIEKMRLGTVATLLSGRRDVIVVSSVSCLYGAGNPADFHATAINIKVGQVVSYKHFLYKLVEALYTRTERELEPATFRVNGDTVDIMAAFGEFGNQCFRVMFFDNEVEAIQSIDPVTGQRIASLDSITLYATNLFVTTKERINAAVQQIYLDLGKQIEFFERAGRPMEAQRIKQRVEYDLEMIKELGYCPGIENYSRYFDGRAAGTRPFCLIDYFPKDYLMVVDESHVTLPQVHAILYADTCTDSMRYAIEQSNRRREKQVRYNMEHEMLPRQAQKSGSGQSALLAGRVDTSEVNMTAYPIAEDHYAAAADVQKNYTASENIDALIDKAREEMERAAKSLDFLAAAKFRDRMYELQKLREENRNQNSQFTIHNS